MALRRNEKALLPDRLVGPACADEPAHEQEELFVRPVSEFIALIRRELPRTILEKTAR